MLEIVAGATGLLTLADKAVGLVDRLSKLGSGAEFNAELSELREVLIATQKSALTANRDQFALEKEKRALEEQLAKFERWDAESQKYQLVDVSNSGVFAHAIKPSAQGSEPFHLLCENCFQHGKKRLWQKTTRNALGARVYECTECKSEYAPRGALPKTIEETESPSV